MRLHLLPLLALLALAPQQTQPGPRSTASGLNPTLWTPFSRSGAPGNNLQCYSPSMVSVTGGFLVLQSMVQTQICQSIDLASTSYPYTSAEIMMKSFNFLYGTVEFKAQLGGGSTGGCGGGSCANSGYWPVIWMESANCQPSDPTGTDDNCDGQEIDITEILNGTFTSVNQQIHVVNDTHNDQCTATGITDVSQNVHTYDLVWSAGSLVWSIDGSTTCTITQAYVPNAPMYVKLAMNVGNSGGTIVPTTMPWITRVSYLKVTQASTVVFSDCFGNPTC